MIKKETVVSEKGPIIKYTESNELDYYDTQRRMIKRPEAEIVNIYVIDG
jgi:hypothetical protein